MAFWNRKDNNKSEVIPAVLAESIVIDRYTGEELERMINEVYNEKLNLERELEKCSRDIERNNNVQDKLNAAELFANQCRIDIDSKEKKIAKLEKELSQTKEDLKQKESRISVMEINYNKLLDKRKGLEIKAKNELIDDMLIVLDDEKGQWSFKRVGEFIKGFEEGDD